MTSYGKYTQAAIDEGCKVNITSESYVGNSGRIIESNVGVMVRNKSGKDMVWVNSRVSLEKALESIENKLKKRASELEEAKYPFQKLVAEVKHITDFVFPNNDKAKKLSSGETYNGWDIEKNTANKCVIRIHNAANWVAHFDMMQSYKEVELNLSSLSTWGVNREMEALPKLLDAIRVYLSVDLDTRKAEFGMKEVTE